MNLFAHGPADGRLREPTPQFILQVAQAILDRIGYVAGLVHYLTALYWLLLIPFRWHGIPVGPGAGWLALGAFLALFPAGWVWLMTQVQSPKSKAHSDSERSVPPYHGETWRAV